MTSRGISRKGISVFPFSEAKAPPRLRLSTISRQADREKRPHPPTLPIIGTGILLPEKGSADEQAAAIEDFGRRDKNLISNQLTLVEKFDILQ
ncbi:MAG: hypothetical protein EOM83_10735 [Clostridia bacterium]|nr:hypothetical protein [Clostridia bacterium]